MELPIAFRQQYTLGESINWKKLKEDKINLAYKIYDELSDSLLDYLKEKGKMSNLITNNSLILFSPDSFDLNPFHRSNEAHWYFTKKGRDEAERYIKDFLEKKGVRITAPKKIID